MSKNLYNSLVLDQFAIDELASNSLDFEVFKGDIKGPVGEYIPNTANFLASFSFGKKNGVMFSLNNGESLMIIRKLGLLSDRVTLIRPKNEKSIKISDIQVILELLISNL